MSTRRYDRTLVTDERIDDFLTRLAKRGRKLDEIRALCLGERNYLKNGLYVPRGVDISKPENRRKLALNSRHNVLTRYRNAIRQRFGDSHPSLQYMTLGRDRGGAKGEATVRAEKNRSAIVQKHNERRALEADVHVTHASLVLSQAAAGGFFPALAIADALIAVTGRRPIEILQCGNFARVKKPDPELFDKTIAASRRWTLKFSGQAKTRGAESAQTEAYEIPVLAPPDLILSVFAALRARYNVQNLTAKQVNDRASKELGKYAKATYRDRDLVPITPSGLRAAYATTAYEWYAPSKHSWNAYTARILGHSPDDLTTSFSYDQFYPVGSKREYDREIRAATQETLDALRAKLGREEDPDQAGYLKAKIEAVARRLGTPAALEKGEAK